MSRTSPGPVGRRRLDASQPVEYEQPVRGPRLESAQAARTVQLVVLAAWAIGFAGSTAAVVAIDVPTWIFRPSAALLTVALAVGLTHRAGGHMRIWVSIASVLMVAAVAFETIALLAAAAMVTATLAAVLAVVATVPADAPLDATREYLIALMVAASGAVGVAAWNASVDVEAFSLFVAGASLVLVLGLVWGLGAGLHGLGRLHLAWLAGIAFVLLLLIVYSEVVRTHGSENLVELIDDSVYWMRTTIGGVPRPVEVLLGFPALLVGIRMRSRRREGWWIQVFAVLGTAVMTTALVSPSAYPSYVGLSTLYSAVLGYLVGLLATWIVLKRSSGSSRRVVQAVVRVEPDRFSGLR